MENKEQPKEFREFETEQQVANGITGKKPFVEPEVSVPIDVLEATTFLQAIGSGVTN